MKFTWPRTYFTILLRHEMETEVGLCHGEWLKRACTLHNVVDYYHHLMPHTLVSWPRLNLWCVCDGCALCTGYQYIIRHCALNSFPPQHFTLIRLLQDAIKRYNVIAATSAYPIQFLSTIYLHYLFHACVHYCPIAFSHIDLVPPDVCTTIAVDRFPRMDDLWPHYSDQSEIANLKIEHKINE